MFLFLFDRFRARIACNICALIWPLVFRVTCFRARPQLLQRFREKLARYVSSHVASRFRSSFFFFFFSPRWKRSCLSMRKINYTNAARPVSFIHRFLSPRFLLRVISFILLACLRDVYNTWNIPFSILRFF